MFCVSEYLRLFYFGLCNILTWIVNRFIKRDSTIFLFGRANGFGGNTRFLFQYLYENKQKYGISKLIWVTYDEKLCVELRKMGYESYTIKSKKGIYYHFKAGVHLVTGGVSSTKLTGKKIRGDLLGEFSGGACHVQMSHALYKLKLHSLQRYNEYGYKKKIFLDLFQFVHGIKFFRHYMLNPGGWDECLYFCASEQMKKDIGSLMKDDPAEYVVEGFPELCKPYKLRESEKELVERLKEDKNSGKKIVLYLPTYRTTDKTKYTNPLNLKVVQSYLSDNNILWVEKFHAGTMEYMYSEDLNDTHTMKLDEGFDINIIIRMADLIISDYSTVCLKGTYFDIPILLYMPDYEEYYKADKGINPMFMENIVAHIAYNADELLQGIGKCLEVGYMDSIWETCENSKLHFFNKIEADYEHITETIMHYIQKTF